MNCVQLSDIVFREGEFAELHIVVDSCWQDLFDLFCSLFMDGCTRKATRVTFDDLLHVKERMRQCQVKCLIERVVFPHDPQPSFAETNFRKLVGADLVSSVIEVLGDAIYRVRFVPTPHATPSPRAGCV